MEPFEESTVRPPCRPVGMAKARVRVSLERDAKIRRGNGHPRGDEMASFDLMAWVCWLKRKGAR